MLFLILVPLSFHKQLCLLSSRGNCRVARRAVNEREKVGETRRGGQRVKYDSLTNENCRKSSELRPPLLIVRQLRGFIPAIGRNFSVQSYRTDFIPQQDGFLPLSVLRLSSTLVESSAVAPLDPCCVMVLVIQVIRCIRLAQKIYGSAVKFRYKEYSINLLIRISLSAGLESFSFGFNFSWMKEMF